MVPCPTLPQLCARYQELDHSTGMIYVGSLLADSADPVSQGDGWADIAQALLMSQLDRPADRARPLVRLAVQCIERVRAQTARSPYADRALARMDATSHPLLDAARAERPGSYDGSGAEIREITVSDADGLIADIVDLDPEDVERTVLCLARYGGPESSPVVAWALRRAVPELQIAALQQVPRYAEQPDVCHEVHALQQRGPSERVAPYLEWALEQLEQLEPRAAPPTEPSPLPPPSLRSRSGRTGRTPPVALPPGPPKRKG
jgi:hypothetical protein